MRSTAITWMVLAIGGAAQSPQAKTAESGPVRVTENVHVKKMVDTPYPLRAEQEQIQGRVVLDVSVAADGKVQSTRVISGNEVLAAAFQEAVKNWQFEPHIMDGSAVPFITRVGMSFALRGNVTDKPPVEPAPPKAADSSSPAPQTPSGSPSTAAPPKEIDRVRVSSGVASGNLIHKVQPVYPGGARGAHVQGSVVLHAIIGKDGLIKQLDVVSGPEELVAAARGAVEQWRYRPYLLNGEPVEVDTKIMINFRLSDPAPLILR